MQNTEIYEIFHKRLPHRPYCTDDPQTFGLIVRPAHMALQKRLIQPNPPCSLSWLIFDVDNENGAFAWDDALLPQPTIAISNPENGHAHLYYGLSVPVCKSFAARSHPIRYAAALEAAYREKLGADFRYGGLVAKNPFHRYWRTTWCPRLYELGELAEYVELKKLPAASVEAAGLGRNCTLFETLRNWSYRAVLPFKRSHGSEDEWSRFVREHADQLNVFVTPLSPGEVKSIAKSVARWAWREFSDHRFSAIQSARGKRGGRPRSTTRDGKPWEALGVSRATYYRKCRHSPPVGGLLH